MNPESLRSSSPNPSSDRLVFHTPQATSLHRKLFAYSQQLLKDLPDCIPPQARSDSKVLLLYLRDLQEKKISLPKQDIPHILRSLEQILNISDILKKLEDTQGDTKIVQALYGEHIREFLSNEKHQQIIEYNQKILFDFFGENFDIPPIPDTITNEQLELWEKNNLSLRWLPRLDMKRYEDLPAWKKKPNYAQYLDAQKIPDNITTLQGGWMLVDTRDKPGYNNGTQMYEDDFLGPTIAELRAKGIIAPYEKNLQSRFNVSPEELEKPEVIQAFAKAYGLPPNQLFLQRSMEFNLIGNMTNQQWDTTNTSEWFGDRYDAGQSRLLGGFSDNGGLSYVGWYHRDDRNSFVGFRLLGRFS